MVSKLVLSIYLNPYTIPHPLIFNYLSTWDVKQQTIKLHFIQTKLSTVVVASKRQSSPAGGPAGKLHS